MQIQLSRKWNCPTPFSTWLTAVQPRLVGTHKALFDFVVGHPSIQKDTKYVRLNIEELFELHFYWNMMILPT